MLRLGLAALLVFALGSPTTPEPRATLAKGPLAGKVVVIDPGHQLGNGRHPVQVNRMVDAGGFRKACNTTGTATNNGFPEATFAFRVAKRVKARLERLGATVRMTRSRNSYSLWGPCVDRRGRFGNGRADLKLSIHADGSAAGNHGFHVIVSTHRHDRRASTAFAKLARRALQQAGFARSSYVGHGTALSFRGDLGTLNLSRMPTVMVELGNMRNASDARTMQRPKGQQRYARALARGIRSYLGEERR